MSRFRRSLLLSLCGVAGVVVTVAGLVALGATGSSQHAISKAQARAAYGRLPLSFEQNRGQAPGRFQYVARGSGYALGLGRGGVELALRRGHRAEAALRVQTPGGRMGTPVAEQALPGRVNYFIGNDRSNWVRNAPTFGRITYQNVWPGIGLAFHGHQGTLEYDLNLAAGANPGAVALRFAGARGITSDGRGGAVIALGGGKMRVPPPRSAQNGHAVQSRLVVSGNTIRIALGAYDHSRPVLVDPDLVYSTYLGGSGFDQGLGITVDSAGNAYDTGLTTGSFPATAGAYQTTYGGGSSDVFVTKLNAAGSALAYSTYLGGGSFEQGNGIAVDSSGNAYITGYTGGSFPTTAGAFQTAYGGGSSDAFVTKLDAAGSALLYSTYLGGNGSDTGNGIAIDSSGNAYITGQTSGSFPTTAGAYQTTYGGGSSLRDAFVTKLNAAGSALTYSTYLGGSLNDHGNGIAVDGSGNAYITGDTGGSFPATVGAYQTTYGGGAGDAFVTKLNAAGSALVYSTYLGGAGNDFASGIAVDSGGSAYITGHANGSFPTTAGAYQTFFGGGSEDAFVAKLNAAGSALTYSTFLGGTSNEYGSGIALDSSGNAYVTGSTGGSFPTTAGAYQASYGGGGGDVFMTKLNSAGSALAYSTYLGGTGNDFSGGIAVDSSGSAYITGYDNGSFPTTAGAYQTTYGGGSDDAFVSKLAVPTPACQPLHQTVSHNAALTLTLPCADANTPLSGLSVLSGPSHGTLGTPDPSTGHIRYSPSAGYSGPDTFTYQATSANGTSTTQTAYLAVAEASQPTCSDSSLSVNQNTTATLVLTCAAAGDPLTLAVVSGPSHGNLGTLSGDTITYTPTSGYTGPDTITFHATDTASSQVSNTATYYLTVVPQQQGPTGQTGATGATGATGPQGPAGQVELVTCKKVKKKNKCTTQLVSGPVKFTTSHSVRALLSRQGTLYATGPVRNKNGKQQLLLSPLHSITPGRYTLTITNGHKVISKPITIA